MTTGGMQQMVGMNQAMQQLFRECPDEHEGVDPVLALVTVIQDRLPFDALFADAASAGICFLECNEYGVLTGYSRSNWSSLGFQ
jgi:hypothetical protein